jgi:hypothetical protein
LNIYKQKGTITTNQPSYTTIVTGLTEGTNEEVTAPKIEMDSNNKIWVAFWTKVSGKFRIKVYSSNDDGNTFTDTNFPTDSNYDWIRPVLLIDSSNNVHVFAQGRTSSYSNDQVLYSKWNGSSWATISVINGDSNNKDMPSAIFDSNGNMHLAVGSGTGYVLYSKFSSGAWSAWENIAIAIHCSIAVDGSNIPHVAYKTSASAIGYSNRTTGTWVAETVYNYSVILGRPSLKILGFAIMIMTFDGSTTRNIWVSTRFNGTWNTGTIGNLQGTPSNEITSNQRACFTLNSFSSDVVYYHATFFSTINGVTNVAYISAPYGSSGTLFQNPKILLSELTFANFSHPASLYRNGALYGFYMTNSGDAVFFKRQTKNDWVQVPNIKYFT